MIIVVADDITGAAEIAGICIRYGISVLFGLDEIPRGEAAVSIVATNSRSESLSGAGATHARLAEEIKKLSPDFVFKKCDSALRGYILAEAEVLQKTFAVNQLFVQPANPAAGRIIRGGQYFVGDKLLHETAFAHDPDFPASTSSVHALLLSNSAMADSGITVGDCTSVADLAAQATRAANQPVAAGSSAFFEQILLAKFPGLKPHNNELNTEADAAYLMFIGSTHESGRRFISGKKGKVPVEVIAEEDVKDSLFEANHIKRQATLLQRWQQENELIVTFSAELSVAKEKQEIYLRRSFTLLKPVLESLRNTRLLVTGGATAYGFLKFTGMTTLTPVHEFSPGVVAMKEAKSGLLIIMKPGSYPWPDNIV